MKKIFILTVMILATAAFSTVSAQVTPAGAGDKDLRDTGVKGRSNELERVDRDAKKEAAKKKNKNNKSEPTPAVTIEQQPEDKLAVKYDEIKTDFEQIQLSQDSIIKAYLSGAKIDYEQIGKFSSEINKSANRLNSNLFPLIAAEIPLAEKVETSGAKEKVKTEKELKTSRSVREIIVDLDNAIGKFAVSPMFQNLRTVEPSVSEKTKLDLEKIIELSELLDAEARKMSKTKN